MHARLGRRGRAGLRLKSLPFRSGLVGLVSPSVRAENIPSLAPCFSARLHTGEALRRGRERIGRVLAFAGYSVVAVGKIGAKAIRIFLFFIENTFFVGREYVVLPPPAVFVERGKSVPPVRARRARGVQAFRAARRKGIVVEQAARGAAVGKSPIQSVAAGSQAVRRLADTVCILSVNVRIGRRKNVQKAGTASRSFLGRNLGFAAEKRTGSTRGLSLSERFKESSRTLGVCSVSGR